MFASVLMRGRVRGLPPVTDLPALRVATTLLVVFAALGLFLMVRALVYNFCSWWDRRHG